MNGRVPTLSAEQLTELIRRAVRDEFDAAGLRVSDSDDRDQAREDFRFLRRFRQFYDNTSRKVGGTVILAIASGAMWLLWIGFQAILPPK